MYIDYVKPIPKYMQKEIKKLDTKHNEINKTRYYAYLTIIKKEICKINNKINLTKKELAYYILFITKVNEIEKYLKLWRK